MLRSGRVELAGRGGEVAAALPAAAAPLARTWCWMVPGLLSASFACTPAAGHGSCPLPWLLPLPCPCPPTSPMLLPQPCEPELGLRVPTLVTRAHPLCQEGHGSPRAPVPAEGLEGGVAVPGTRLLAC